MIDSMIYVRAAQHRGQALLKKHCSQCSGSPQSWVIFGIYLEQYTLLLVYYNVFMFSWVRRMNCNALMDISLSLTPSLTPSLLLPLSYSLSPTPSLSFLLSHFLSLPLTLSSTHKQSDRSKFLFACVSQVNVEHSETLANIQPKKGFGRPWWPPILMTFHPTASQHTVGGSSAGHFREVLMSAWW